MPEGRKKRACVIDRLVPIMPKQLSIILWCTSFHIDIKIEIPTIVQTVDQDRQLMKLYILVWHQVQMMYLHNTMSPKTCSQFITARSYSKITKKNMP